MHPDYQGLQYEFTLLVTYLQRYKDSLKAVYRNNKSWRVITRD